MNIINAIRRKQRIRFTYAGQQRVVEPHTLGMNKHGKMALHGFQLSGNRPGEANGWTLFQTDAMRHVEVLPETFAFPQSGFRRGTEAFWSIHAEV